MLHVLLFYFVSGVFSRQYLSVDCTSLPQADYPFCNPGLTPATRAWDLVSRLTTEELYGQCGANAESILRLGINKYNWRSNCLHGWAKSGGQWPEGVFWTNFPTPLGRLICCSLVEWLLSWGMLKQCVHCGLCMIQVYWFLFCK